MAIIRQNTFEGGNDGDAITTGNSGGVSGDAFNYATAQGATTFEATDPIRGVLSALMVLGSGDFNALGWDLPDVSVTAFRGYVTVSDATPAGNTRLFYGENNGDPIFDVQLTTDGAIRIRDNGLTERYRTGAGIITPGEKFRVEARVDHSLTVGHLQLRVWTGTDVESPNPNDAEEVGSPTADWDTGAVCDRFDLRVSNQSQTISIRYDEVAVDDADWIGPSTVPVDIDLVPGVILGLGAPVGLDVVRRLVGRSIHYDFANKAINIISGV